MTRIRDQIRLSAESGVWTLIRGPRGSGKRLVARTIHHSKAGGPLIVLDCGGSLPTVEAVARLREAWHVAGDGTMVLRAVDQLPIEGQEEVLGLMALPGASRRKRPHIVSIVSPSVDEGGPIPTLSRDFYNRISLIAIEIPPLCDHPQDIAPIAEHFLRQASDAAGHRGLSMTDAERRRFRKRPWPGNVRELRMAVELAVLRTGAGAATMPGDSVGPLEPETMRDPGPRTLTELEVCERRILERALDEAKGRVYGDLGAAARLGVPPTTLTYRLKKLGIRIPRSRSRPTWDSSRLRR